MRSEFKILIGEKTAEIVKMSIGPCITLGYMETEVRGRDFTYRTYLVKL